jgi:hypothetical protein
MGEGLASKLPALFFRHRQDLIGNVGIQFFQPRKLFRLGLIEAKERELERLS